MTYAGFLLIFLVIPLLFLWLLLRQHLREKGYWLLMALLPPLSLAFMAPWDHVAVVWGLWSWTTPQTWGIRLWQIPLEEYLFCVLETMLAITLTYALFVWSRNWSHTASGEQDV